MDRRTFLKYAAQGSICATIPYLLLNGCSRKRPSSISQRPNVVVILCDTLRPDYLEFNGYPKKVAPFLSKLSKNSVVFERAFSTSSWTAPSTASLFTSMYPHRHGVVEGTHFHQRLAKELEKEGKVVLELNRIPSDIPTMPEIFKAIGYSTLGVAANINIDSPIGFSRGFDRFEFRHQFPASALYSKVKKWVNKLSEPKPIFLYMHLNDPHAPYVKHLLYYDKPKDKEDDDRAKYLSEIGYLDNIIKKIYDFMGADSNTIFVVVSDHGEEFRDHGQTGHPDTLYRELTNVLMMFHAPFLELKPDRIDKNVNLIDVLPTILDLVNFKKDLGMEGVSLAPILRSDSQAEKLGQTLDERTLFAHRLAVWSKGQLWAAIYKHWNMIEFIDGGKVLFDHRNDLPEKHDVFSENQGLTDELTAKLEHFKVYGKRTNSETAPINIDKDMVEMLKTLGYVGE